VRRFSVGPWGGGRGKSNRGKVIWRKILRITMCDRKNSSKKGGENKSNYKSAPRRGSQDNQKPTKFVSAKPKNTMGGKFRRLKKREGEIATGSFRQKADEACGDFNHNTKWRKRNQKGQLFDRKGDLEKVATTKQTISK